MSVGATPSLFFIGSTVGDTAPFSLSEMRGIRFSDGTNSPTSGAISLGNFRNKVLTPAFVQKAKFQSNDIQAGDQFGNSVALSFDGSTALVGAISEDAGGSNAGAVYVFIRSGTTWTQQAKLLASDPQATDNYGWTVSITSDGNYAIVGAPNKNNFAGAAYIYIRSGTTWTQQTRLLAPSGQGFDQFGQVGIASNKGDYAIVGATGDDAGGSNTGAAYIYIRSGTTWTQQTRLLASDRQSGDGFGSGVALSGTGTYAIVGAWGEDAGGSNAGAAYIFVRSGTTWTQQAKLMASDAQASDYFGNSVAMSYNGDRVIVGAYGEDTGGSTAGAAYIFVRSGTTWTQQAKLMASDAQGGDLFGNHVAISANGDRVIVGAQNEDAVGAAYTFIRSGTTWTQQSKIRASDPQAGDQFGYGVAISLDGNYAMVGAHYEDTGGAEAGAVYAFNNSYYV